MSAKSPKGSKIIRICCHKEEYYSALNDSQKFKQLLDQEIIIYPELFPEGISKGYTLNGKTDPSKKLDKQQFQKIKLCSNGEIYSIYPSFVMPNMIAYTDEVEKALFFRKFSAPYSALVYAFGKDEMYWYRAEKSFSPCSIVGTTIKKKEKLPEHSASDEKHGKINGSKVYIAMTVANGCILGAEVTPEANEKELTKGYGVFAEESRNLDPTYTPTTVNIDGWEATKLSMKALFFGITIIRCFLHAFIKIRDCCKKHVLFDVICEKIWDVYKSKNKKTFSQRLRRLKDWAVNKLSGTTALEKIEKTYQRSKEYQIAYDHPECHRTSNMCDRLMRFIDRALFDRQNFHGTIQSATEMSHSWAILHNYYPHRMRDTINKTNVLSCPASDLNGFTYSNNWLNNLVTASSMNGYRQ